MPYGHEYLVNVHPGALRQEAVNNLQSNEVFQSFPEDVRRLIIFFTQAQIIKQFHGGESVHSEAAEYIINEAIGISNEELEKARRELSKKISKMQE
jgi:hypothetical protein